MVPEPSLGRPTTQLAVPSVRVAAFPDLERYARVMHLVATVIGRLRPDVTLEELLRATFPGGSISGCPKLAAIGLIRELGKAGRGPYTGALGWFSHDLSQLDLGMVIRTAWADTRVEAGRRGRQRLGLRSGRRVSGDRAQSSLTHRMPPLTSEVQVTAD
jgi:hypothetical protein